MSDELLSQDEIEALMAGGGEGDAAQPAEANPKAAKKAKSEGAAQEQEPPPASGPDIRMTTTPESAVRPAAFTPISGSADTGVRSGVDLLLDVQLNVAVELGRAQLHVRDILGLGPGAVVELDKHSGEPVEVVVNGKLLARGEVVLIDENFGVRITEIVSKPERDGHAKAA